MLLWYFLLAISVVEPQQNESTTEEFGSDDPFYPTLEWSDVFDWKLLTVLSRKSPNILFSPASLQLVLSILYEASSGATQNNFEDTLQYITKKSIREKTRRTIDALHVSPTSENRLSLSTRIFLDSKIRIKDIYAKKIKDNYNTDVFPSNFTDTEATSATINAWASEYTQGAIKRLTEPDDVRDMIMLLANAIHFKGVWRYPFPKNETCVGGFYTNPGTKIYVPFMTTTNLFYFLESQVLEAKILRLPYKGNRFSMFLILPFAQGGLPALLEKVNLLNLHRELHYLDRRAVLVSIPKFSFKLKASYKGVLQEFGLTKIFQNSASFTGIAEGNSKLLRELVVSDILQSAGIDVDEEGTVAFAATDVIIGNKIGVPENVFNATHPFIFFIQDDNSGTILFLGKVDSPLYQDLEIKKELDDIEKDFQST
ncbi:hypothetical protein HUJ04_012580 [Dendroctonus ponderosae]